MTKRIKIKIDPKKLKKNIKIVPKDHVRKSSEINMFELGTLVQVQINRWQGNKKISDEIVKQLRKKALAQGNKTKAKWVKGSKDIINRKHLKPITSVVVELNNTLEFYASPFPIRGIYFIPNANIPAFKMKADALIKRFHKQVNELHKNMDKFIDEAEEQLSPDGLFDRRDYPLDVRNRFNMFYRFFELTLPTKAVNAIEDEEANKFKELLNEARDTSILALRNGFGDLIKTITDTLSGRLDGERKRMSQKTIDRIASFVDEFNAKNIFNDKELETVINKANKILDGVTNKDLKDNEDLIKSVNDDLQDVRTELEKGIKTYKRKLKLS